MFFFIAGIQPKTVELDAPSRMCPKCGLYQAQLKRVDHYLSLFFIPLFPVKKGNPFLECRRCAGVFTESGQPWFEPFPKGSIPLSGLRATDGCLLSLLSVLRKTASVKGTGRAEKIRIVLARLVLKRP